MNPPKIVEDYLQIKDIKQEIQDLFIEQRENNKTYDEMLLSYNYYDLETLYKLSSFHRIHHYDFCYLQWREGENKTEYYNKIVMLYDNYKIPFNFDKHYIILDILNTKYEDFGGFHKHYETLMKHYKDFYNYIVCIEKDLK